MSIDEWSNEVAPHDMGPMAEDYETRPDDYDAEELEQSVAWVDGGMQLMEVQDFMFRILVDDLPDSVCVFQPDGRIVWANRAWLAIPGEDFGLRVEDVAGHRLEELLVAPQYAEPLAARWEAVQSLTPDRNLVMHTFPVSESRTQQIRYKGWFTGEGEPVLYVAVGRDHTAAQEAETRLRESLRRLAESNRDLQDFAYVASHDLQEPLRKIIAFTDRLRDTVGDLDEKPADYLDRVQNASQRMQTLIDDLLTFSRVTTRGEDFRRTDLNEVVSGVLGDLEVAVADTGAQVDVGPLPTLDADPTQMRQLFQNLIANALKFHRAGVAPVVSVRAERLNDHVLVVGDEPRSYWRVCVADNGIGFDDKYAQKIFTVFQRLHGRGRYEGSGIGLSVCRRIVERHEGQIEASGRPEEGAVFVFTLAERLAELND
ncbi:MAG: ATP-binding protein [Acidimicrobiia bacterium]|nr:ATP-binding protein [Acidimicrobiia bacterium]